MEVIYQDDIQGVAVEHLVGFFEGWPNPPSPETHLRLMQASDRVSLARLACGKVVGFVTAVTDGVLSAYVPLLEVLPEYQGRGIGTILMERVLCQLDGLYMVDLTCDPELQPYYARMGFRESVGMSLRRYDRQSGLIE